MDGSLNFTENSKYKKYYTPTDKHNIQQNRRLKFSTEFLITVHIYYRRIFFQYLHERRK